MEDALALGGACISLLNHAARVKCACLAQLVNVIAPIMTETGGGAWRQTIFYPFAHMSRFGRGRVLRSQIKCETYAASYYDPRGSLEQSFPIPAAPYLKLAAVADASGGLSLFALNRDLAQAMTVTVEARGFGELTPSEAWQLRDDDLDAVNSKAAPDRIRPTALAGVACDGAKLTLRLAPASWNLIACKSKVQRDRAGGEYDQHGP